MPCAACSVNDSREAGGPVMAVAREAADAGAVPAQPSCLISWTHSEPDGGWAIFDGWPPDPTATITRLVVAGIATIILSVVLIADVVFLY